MIFLIEGADGCGKTTLAEYIAKELNGMVLHAIYRPEINMEVYHKDLLTFARVFSNMGIPIILDRWALSEIIYGNVFRDGPSYDAESLLEQNDITYIYCHNDDVVVNHKRNSKTRKEMFDDMEEVASQYDTYIEKSNLPWNIYDFNYNNKESFLRGLST
jgi:thymidylate kinase